jgi:penicillin-binding protein 1A
VSAPHPPRPPGRPEAPPYVPQVAAAPPPPREPRRLVDRLRQRPPRWLLVALLVALLLAIVGWSRCGIAGCPDVSRLGAYQPGGAPVLVDRYGKEIGELKLAEQVVVSLADLPPFVAEAFLAVEDKRFREHSGVDWRRVGGALFSNLKAGGIREGSSTLTMQLARNLFSERIPAAQKTMRRKLLEVRVARSIEKAYSKDEILELYLNHIYFGGGTRGIEAASQYYFRHSAKSLTLREAALLAALPKAPTHYDPRRNPEGARERRDLVLDLMAEQGRLDQDEADEAKETTLGVSKRPRRAEREEPFAGWFVEQVRRQVEEEFGDSLYRDRVRIVTTLDRRAQEAAERELGAQLRRIESGAWGRFRGPRYSPSAEGDEEGTSYLQGAVVLVEAESGDVLAWVGGRDFEDSRFDRAEQARRQIGSAFKPFVFAAAIASGLPSTQQVSDQPMTVTMVGGEEWRPRNFGDSYLPSVTLRQALVESRNVATIRVAQSVGSDRVADIAELAGLPGAPDVPSAALGVTAASPAQLTAAYTPFANLGDRVAPRFLLRVESEDRGTIWEADEPRREEVLDPAVAYVVGDFLRDAVRRGTATAANFGMRVPTGGKTGTTNEQQDVWFVGFTPDVVGSIWIGFDQPRSIVNDASGGRLAAPVWGRIMRRVYQHRDRPAAWPVPAGVSTAQVDATTGAVLAEGCQSPAGQTYREVFLDGTVPAASCPGGDPSLWNRLQWWWSDQPAAEAPLEATPTPAPTPELQMLPPDMSGEVQIPYTFGTEPGIEPTPGEEILVEPAAPAGPPAPTGTPIARPPAPEAPAPTAPPAATAPPRPVRPPATLAPVPVEPPPVAEPTAPPPAETPPPPPPAGPAPTASPPEVASAA